MKNKVGVFSGSGLSAESGIETFRDAVNGLWYNYKVDDVATLSGWKKDRELVLEFHNMLRSKLYTIEPNDAHKALAELSKNARVTNVTQNVDDLLERAGCKDVIHIHGELLKCNSSVKPKVTYDCRGSINLGDKCEFGSQLKPNTVLFGEYPYRLDEAFDGILNSDYVIIVGTTFTIGYTQTLIEQLSKSGKDYKVYYIDPKPTMLPSFGNLNIEVIKKTAVEGVRELTNKIADEIRQNEMMEG